MCARIWFTIGFTMHDSKMLPERLLMNCINSSLIRDVLPDVLESEPESLRLNRVFIEAWQSRHSIF